MKAHTVGKSPLQYSPRTQSLALQFRHSFVLRRSCWNFCKTHLPNVQMDKIVCLPANSFKRIIHLHGFDRRILLVSNSAKNTPICSDTLQMNCRQFDDQKRPLKHSSALFQRADLFFLPYPSLNVSTMLTMHADERAYIAIVICPFTDDLVESNHLACLFLHIMEMM